MADTFVFYAAFGNDTITDFDAVDSNEKIMLIDIDTIESFADLAANHMTQGDGGVLIDDHAGNTIWVADVLIDQMDSSDFLF